jgi:hypothetical protein
LAPWPSSHIARVARFPRRLRLETVRKVVV